MIFPNLFALLFELLQTLRHVVWTAALFNSVQFSQVELEFAEAAASDAMSTHQYLDAATRCRTYNANYANNICQDKHSSWLGPGPGPGLGRPGAAGRITGALIESNAGANQIGINLV